MALTNISVRMDSDLKHQFESFCNDVGLTMSAAINIFAKKVVHEYRIPFEIALEKPNEDTLAAIAEVKEMQKHPESLKTYSTFKELVSEVMSDA